MKPKNIDDLRKFTSKCGLNDSLVVTKDEWGCVSHKALKQLAIDRCKELNGNLEKYEEYTGNSWRKREKHWENLFPDVMYDSEYEWHIQIVKHQIKELMRIFNLKEKDLNAKKLP